jgi:hypothetical protein
LREIRQLVKKYQKPHDKAVIRQAMSNGRINKSELIRNGVTKKQIMSIFGRLRKTLKDYKDGENE